MRVCGSSSRIVTEFVESTMHSLTQLREYPYLLSFVTYLRLLKNIHPLWKHHQRKGIAYSRHHLVVTHTHTHTHRGTQHSLWQSSYEHQPFLYHIISLPAAAVVSIVGGQEEGGRRDSRSKNVVCACAPISGGSWV